MIDRSMTKAAATFLNGPAGTELERCVERYQAELLAEAGRLEAAAHTADTEPEITSSMVRDADLLLRRGYRKPKQSNGWIAAKITALVGSFLTGMLADLNKLTHPKALITFIVILSVTIVFSVITTLKE